RHAHQHAQAVIRERGEAHRRFSPPSYWYLPHQLTVINSNSSRDDELPITIFGAFRQMAAAGMEMAAYRAGSVSRRRKDEKHDDGRRFP
ncbi:MAG: hypothetical protein KDD97_05430, partial [Rhodobacteraceae bacterium]|nr:hypothetical protein [Paracoccaceae bacterium]